MVHSDIAPGTKLRNLVCACSWDKNDHIYQSLRGWIYVKLQLVPPNHMDLHLGSAHSRIAWDPQKQALPQETDRARKWLGLIIKLI